MSNQCLYCDVEIPEGEGHVCRKCMRELLAAEPAQPSCNVMAQEGNTRAFFHREKPFNKLEIWLLKLVGITAKNLRRD